MQDMVPINYRGRNGEIQGIARAFLNYENFPPGMLRETSVRFAQIVNELLEALPDSEVLVEALRKTLAARDAAIYAVTEGR